MPDIDIPALRHLVANTEILNSEVSCPVDDPGCYVPVSELSALLDAAEQRDRLLTALTVLSEGHETELPEDSINGYCAGCDPWGYAREVLARESGRVTALTGAGETDR